MATLDINNIFIYIVCFQDDEDGHLVVLQIIEDLMNKAQDIFLDHFARLGVFSKVAQLAGPQDPAPLQISDNTIKKEENVSQLILFFLYFYYYYLFY